MSSAELMEQIPAVVPCYATNGSSFNPSQTIEIEIPSSSMLFKPRECFIELNVKFPDVPYSAVAPVAQASYTPPQCWGSAGVHGIIRDIVIQDLASGRELDRINYYNQACKMLPFITSSNDDSAYLAQQEGLNQWKTEAQIAGSVVQLGKDLNAIDRFDLHYQHFTTTNNSVITNVSASVGTSARYVKYSIPIRFGFLSSEEEYVNLSGLKVQILLSRAQECCDYWVTSPQVFLENTTGTTTVDFPNPVNSPQFSAILAPAGASSLVLGVGNPTVALSPDVSLAIANTYPVGTQIILNDGVNPAETVTIQSYANNGANVTIGFAPVTTAVTGQSSVTFASPLLASLNYQVTQPILYVRQTQATAEMMRMKLMEIKEQPESAGYTFRTLYNYPLSIPASVSNPVLNFNALAKKYATALFFVAQNESDLNSLSTHSPGRLLSCLKTATTGYPVASANITQYQVKLGNKLLINQPINIDQLVPQVLNKEIQSALELGLAKKVCNLGYHSIDWSGSTATQSKADIYQFYNRIIGCALVPDEMSVRDITEQNIQLLLFTPSGADPSSYTIHLFVSHYKHLIQSPSGQIIDE